MPRIVEYGGVWWTGQMKAYSPAVGNVHSPDHDPLLYDIGTPGVHVGVGPLVNSTKCSLVPGS